MLNNPYVSVIIPNYCHAIYLDQRIQSVLNQTYQNFEVIILDDASQDKGASKAVIEKYRDNPHVNHIVYNEQNSGSTFKQWNKGFELAKGELIWIAESDDYCDTDFLENIIPCWEKYPSCSIVESALWEVDSEGNKLCPERKYNGQIEFSKGQVFIKWKLVQSNLYIPNASAVTFKKSLALSVAKDYVQYKASGDRLFWVYMLEKGDICVVQKPLSYFRQHQIKVTQKKELDGTQGRENYRINQYLKKKGYIKGIIAVEAFRFYWRYFHYQEFLSEEIRQELINLWFPWWKRLKLYRLYIESYYSIYGRLYSFYKSIK